MGHSWERSDGILFLLEKITSRCEKTINSVIDAKNEQQKSFDHTQTNLSEATDDNTSMKFQQTCKTNCIFLLITHTHT